MSKRVTFAPQPPERDRISSVERTRPQSARTTTSMLKKEFDGISQIIIDRRPSTARPSSRDRNATLGKTSPASAEGPIVSRILSTKALLRNSIFTNTVLLDEALNVVDTAIKGLRKGRSGALEDAQPFVKARDAVSRPRHALEELLSCADGMLNDILRRVQTLQIEKDSLQVRCNSPPFATNLMSVLLSNFTLSLRAFFVSFL